MRWTFIVGIRCRKRRCRSNNHPHELRRLQAVDIYARDGDRIIVDDDARIQIVRRRQATLRTIYSQESNDC